MAVKTKTVICPYVILSTFSHLFAPVSSASDDKLEYKLQPDSQ